MSRRRLLVAASVSLALLVVAVALRMQHRDPPPHTPSPLPVAEPVATALSRRLAPPPAITAATIRSDPARAARIWLDRPARTKTRRNARNLGEDAAALLDRPPAEAWPLLREKAEDGDERMLTAAALLASACAALARLPVAATAPHSAYGDRLDGAGLPSEWVTFLRDIDDAQQAQLAAQKDSCKGVVGVMDFMLMALDRFVQPNDPEVQLGEADEIADDAAAIAALRTLDAQLDSVPAKRALAVRLLKSRDPDEQTEGRRLLEALADDDSLSVALLAACLVKGCGHFGGDAVDGPPWLERAAGMGWAWALREQIDALQTSHRSVDAWAWALYQLDLASAACSDLGNPQVISLGLAATSAAQIQATLNAQQQADGLAAEAAIARSWQARAMVALDCNG